jgi:hypothetical protein
MRSFVKTTAICALLLATLAGCGGSGSTAGDPFQNAAAGGAPSQNPVYNNISTATGKMTLSLTTDVPSIDVDNGQVMAIAKVKAGETPIAGMAVTFSVLAPTNLATIENATVTTDSTGTAVTRVTTGHTASTSNVLISANIKVGTQTIITDANFQLIRGSGVIMFTDMAGLSPGGQSDLYPPRTATVPPGEWTYLQLIPVKLTDSNGNPRVGVPVTLTVYNISTLAVDPKVTRPSVDFVVQPGTENNQETVVTDSAGQAIFSSRIHLEGVVAKQTTTVAIIYKAITQDTIPVSAFLGAGYSVTGEDDTTTAATAQ